jgi:hypothetical protein
MYKTFEVEVGLNELISGNLESSLDLLSTLATTGLCSNGEGSECLTDIEYELVGCRGYEGVLILKVSGDISLHHKIHGDENCTHLQEEKSENVG